MKKCFFILMVFFCYKIVEGQNLTNQLSTSTKSVEEKIKISSGEVSMEKEIIILPEPKKQGNISVEECIANRRSIRDFQKQDLSIEQISQILWSAQGITDTKRKFRAAPSAGALYPMELYLMCSKGVFHYLPEVHKLERISNKDLRRELSDASWGQSFIADAGISVVLCAVYGRTTWRYGQRGIRYVDMEAGHIAQNIHLQAVALGLGSVPVGAFSDEKVKSLLSLPKDHQPIYIIPVGYPVE
ncbi:MAG: SagB/ThcOx family dehydrogenase [Endomicrobiia bacterium]